MVQTAQPAEMGTETTGAQGADSVKRIQCQLPQLANLSMDVPINDGWLPETAGTQRYMAGQP